MPKPDATRAASDAIFDRGLPTHVPLEKLILGAILLDGELFSVARGIVDTADFAIEKHQRIWTAIANTWDRGESVNRITVANELKQQNILADVGGLSYLVSLDDDLPQICKIEDFCKVVREKSILRRCIHASQALIDRCMLPGAVPESVLTEAETVLRDLEDSAAPSEDGLQHMRDIFLNFPGGLDGLIFPPEEARGIPLPLRSMNRLLGGLKKKELIVIGARPAHGKTALATQIIDHAGSLGFRCAMFSLEMTKAELMKRMLSCRGRVDSARIDAGVLVDREIHALQKAANQLAEMPIFIDDSTGSTVFAIHSACRKQKADTGLDLVVIDYLQLMEAHGKGLDNRTQELSQITRRLKLMATEFDIPVVVLSQLNRDNEREKRRPELRDLRESGSIEQDANKVIFPYRPPAIAEGMPVTTSEFIVAKNRNGPTGKAVVGFVSQFTRFEELIQDDDEMNGL